jgi:plastocyanin
MPRNQHSAVIVASAVVLIATELAAAGRAGSDEPAAAPAAANVTIDNFSFAPATLTVKAGATVTWTNKDDMPHTVVSTDKSFASRALDTGEAFTYTFGSPGTFDYFCSIHPRMTGRVVVVAN